MAERLGIEQLPSKRASKIKGSNRDSGGVTTGWGSLKRISNSIVVFWQVTDEPSSRHGGLLLGKQRGKEVFRPLPKLEALVGIEDQRLHQCLGLLTTRFPDGFEGGAAFCR